MLCTFDLALGLVALGVAPLVVNAVTVQLFIDSNCPTTNPGPICTNVAEQECCKDHVGNVANYYSSASISGLAASNYNVIMAWNQDSTCGQAASITSGDGCKGTPGGFRNGYGLYWIKCYPPTSWYCHPYGTTRHEALDSVHVTTNGTIDAIPAEAKCTKSVAPDVYHIKLSANSTAIPIARKIVLEITAAAGANSRQGNVADIWSLSDRETGVVKADKLELVKGVLANHGDGLTEEQLTILRGLGKSSA
ncbi:hypothetical protein D9611_004527 [Ephemerocybe angulata]|uniref:Uncharacterized protein n=1 Tax=Ephemerocybe angulata TaxID=980116 RepID=A0A8H5BJS1_9AGAR|nr:hypothetical protein D9611_004527 [Tulosesus angulatus]